MKVCGYNQFSALGINSNNQDFIGSEFISPPLNSKIKIRSLLSFSIFSEHSVLINKEYQGFALGYNKDFRIHSSLPKGTIPTQKNIIFGSKKKSNLKLISAICGEYYTLYLFSSDDQTMHELAYISSINRGSPLFLNLNGRTQKFLFGGYETAAVIDTDGLIYVIKDSIFTTQDKTVVPFKLPKNDRAVSIACCNQFIVVLGSSGRVFGSSLKSLGTKQLNFVSVDELSGSDIVEISGTYKHCLAVSRDGRVFARGSNEFGETGTGENSSPKTKFTQIMALSKYCVVSASAGFSHSLFITSDGRVIGCGKNDYGQLLLSCGQTKNFIYLPTESIVTSGASYCIAGNCTSVIFTGGQIPLNTPNRVVKERSMVESRKDDADDESSSEVAKLREEIQKLKDENMMIAKEKKQLNDLYSKVLKEVSLIKNGNSYLQNEIRLIKDEKSLANHLSAKLKKDVSKLQNENALIKDENSKLKKENDFIKEENEFLKITNQKLLSTKKDIKNDTNNHKDGSVQQEKLKTKKDISLSDSKKEVIIDTKTLITKDQTNDSAITIEKSLRSLAFGPKDNKIKNTNQNNSKTQIGNLFFKDNEYPTDTDAKIDFKLCQNNKFKNLNINFNQNDSKNQNENPFLQRNDNHIQNPTLRDIKSMDFLFSLIQNFDFSIHLRAAQNIFLKFSLNFFDFFV